MNGWLAIVVAAVVITVAGVRELLRWRAGRWEGGMRPGSRRRGG